MCLECFAAGQTGETCGACGAPRAKANQDVWGFDDPSPAGSPRAPPAPPAEDPLDLGQPRFHAGWKSDSRRPHAIDATLTA